MANQNSNLKPWEIKARDYFNSVMNKDNKIRHCFGDSRLALNELAIGLYEEVTKGKISSTVPNQLQYAIDELWNKKVFPNEGLRHSMHFIRIVGNDTLHGNDEFNIELLNSIRLCLLSIFKWYFVTYRNIKLYSKDYDQLSSEINKTKEDALLKFLRVEGLSEDSIKQIIKTRKKKKEFVNVETSDQPTFALFLLDESGSMDVHKSDVIFAHSELLNALRGSDKCERESLLLMQYKFNTAPSELNSLQQLDKKGKDNVVKLSTTSYIPNGGTSIFDTLAVTLNDITEEIATTRERKGKKAELNISLITDGQDNSSSVKPSQVKDIVSDLQKRKYLKSSVIIGLTNDSSVAAERFTEEDLQAMKAALGFKFAVSVSNLKALPNDIRRQIMRRIFDLVSKVSLGQDFDINREWQKIKTQFNLK